MRCQRLSAEETGHALDAGRIIHPASHFTLTTSVLLLNKKGETMSGTFISKKNWSDALTVVGSIAVITAAIWLITNCASCH